MDQKKAAKEFSAYWANKGYEKGESQPFWMSLLHNVFGVEHPEQYIEFENQVHLDTSTGFIDGYIPDTKVMIEQKSRGKNLNQAILQSDGSKLTPFQQAKKYIVDLPVDRHPKWVITCNFEEFFIYDMNHPQGEPEKIKLADLDKEYYRLQFLVDKDKINIGIELDISVAAGTIIGKIYDAFLKQYKDPESSIALHSLNVLCVRLVFCLYAEDSGIFPKFGQFHDYLASFNVGQMRGALLELFKVLDQKEKERDDYLDDTLNDFPYVNGGLFKDDGIIVPKFTDEIRELILVEASEQFNWSQISPTIFGAVFESTLNPDTRRSGGMHYTSVQNIHRVLDPLFLDDLKAELREALNKPMAGGSRTKAMQAYRDKLSSLIFFDPACGSGNFLTEIYLCLRRLENDVIRYFSDELEGQIAIGGMISDEELGIRVKISQLSGIEINDFAVSVARTALWIAEHQMMLETQEIVKRNLTFLPLKTDAKIVEGNALRMNWEDVVDKSRLSYIVGNPPFVGYAFQSPKQKEDLRLVCPTDSKNIDYVSGWFFKAADMMQGNTIRSAFVATNSITQGEQVCSVWQPLFEERNVHIDYGYQTFRWDSEASIKAHVHCVIVGFSCAPTRKKKYVFSSDRAEEVESINAYLLGAPDVFIERRTKPICDVPPIYRGSQPTDDGNLILTSEDKDALLKAEPQAAKFIRPFMMGKDFINRKPRYCLWLDGANPAEVRKCPKIMERVERVRQFRLNSKKKATRVKADYPMLFDENHECKSDYVAIPKVSSENRRYVPMEYLKQEVVAGDKLFMMPTGSLYHFGVLTSNVHMAWMRAVCGRLKSDYSYSNTIVYNNFPWPSPTDAQREKIEKSAQAILDARALYPESSMADLYDDLAMPPELRKAHQMNDRAVMQAYGIPVKGTTESDCVAFLMKKYKELTEQ